MDQQKDFDQDKYLANCLVNEQGSAETVGVQGQAIVDQGSTRTSTDIVPLGRTTGVQGVQAVLKVYRDCTSMYLWQLYS